ncbi:NAD(P)H-flavin reductase [Actinoplanes octamycinicus]|uniref:NAD(P)H-flavin reductase n=1 Tax=Actinoplanes octamycinicus TaxID=135948 RepID=A0A7W7H2M1_9ACTN|nr:FAD/NAD(P)-binding protein [Actinoplanes octamycinicus]MBB4742851.1 NAD(P)H-flavin reductase [Actinoplanes octamycinicus]GIE58296.1 oxidoreductase [Actinoplanes octamycinicus]
MNPAVPQPGRVVRRRQDTADTVTIELTGAGQPLPAFQPGQFAMLTAYGVGDVPISISGIEGARPTHTIRAVGAVTRALCAARPGDLIGVRGPFGIGWDLDAAAGHDVLVVAGGIGLAPLRPVVERLLADRASYRKVSVLVGARQPAELLYPDDLARWSAQAQILTVVDRPADGWTGPVGLVTTVIPAAAVDPATSVAYLCGPELMMRFTAQALISRGVPAEQVQVSLERCMRCGVGWCGHCQLGPLLICRDGPVVPYPVAEPLLSTREL